MLSAGSAHIQGLYAVCHYAQPIARRSLIKCILNVILNKLLRLIIVRLRG
jgi:hypothetical protein